MIEKQNVKNVLGGGTPSKISVAMATYNGEKYIQEQLLSICCQTRKPDQVVVSDDGSRDGTLDIVHRIALSEAAQGIEFIVLTDNPRHGYNGNFEWASKHCTGDIVFFCDQDDVWLPEKVEAVQNVFEKLPQATLVAHYASLVDKNGDPMEGTFNDRLKKEEMTAVAPEIYSVPWEPYLERSVSTPLINGMVLAARKTMLNRQEFAFPKMSGSHDHWLCFCGLCENGFYFLDRTLTKYRLHGNNTCGLRRQQRSLKDSLKRCFQQMKTRNRSMVELFTMGRSMRTVLQLYNLQSTPAYGTCCRIVEIGEKQVKASGSGRIAGACQLIKLFFTDMRYRRCGTVSFLYQLLYILLNSKKHRIQTLREQGVSSQFNPN